MKSLRQPYFTRTPHTIHPITIVVVVVVVIVGSLLPTLVKFLIKYPPTPPLRKSVLCDGGLEEWINAVEYDALTSDRSADA
jgi:hypothetical protein